MFLAIGTFLIDKDWFGYIFRLGRFELWIKNTYERDFYLYPKFFGEHNAPGFRAIVWGYAEVRIWRKITVWGERRKKGYMYEY